MEQRADNELEMPNVIRAIIPEQITTQSVQTVLQRSRPHSIQPKNNALDTFCMKHDRPKEPGRTGLHSYWWRSAFDELANLLNQYSYLVPVETLERWHGTQKNANLYLKVDFKLSNVVKMNVSLKKSKIPLSLSILLSAQRTNSNLARFPLVFTR